MANAFEVVSSRLLLTSVGRERSISGCASQVLSFFERDVLSFAIAPLLGETEVNHVDFVSVDLSSPN